MIYIRAPLERYAEAYCLYIDFNNDLSMGIKEILLVFVQHFGCAIDFCCKFNKETFISYTTPLL